MKAQRITVLAVLAFVACAAILAGTVIKAQQIDAPQHVAPSSATTMADVDNALAKGPVFIEFESASCHYCQQQHPISQKLANDYAGKVTFFFVDANENRDLAHAFQVTSVPQMDIIAGKTNGKYAYIDSNGAPSESIGSSKILGLTESGVLSKALDAAIQYKK